MAKVKLTYAMNNGTTFSDIALRRYEQVFVYLNEDLCTTWAWKNYHLDYTPYSLENIFTKEYLRKHEPILESVEEYKTQTKVKIKKVKK